MKSILRQPVALAVGLVTILFLGFAALAQTPSDSAAKQDSLSPDYAELSRLFFGPRPRGCFCDEDCFAALLKKEKASRRPRLFANHENEVRVIDLDGLKKLLQRDGKDTRPLLINFWATWCDPCREEFPDLVKVDGDYRNKGLNFIAVSLDDITDIKTAVPKFLAEMKAQMPVVLLNVNDPEPAIKAVDTAWDGQMPATFLYDKDGKVVFKHFGKINPDELRAAIDKEVSRKQ